MSRAGNKKTRKNGERKRKKKALLPTVLAWSSLSGLAFFWPLFLFYLVRACWCAGVLSFVRQQTAFEPYVEADRVSASRGSPARQTARLTCRRHWKQRKREATSLPSIHPTGNPKRKKKAREAPKRGELTRCASLSLSGLLVFFSVRPSSISSPS